MLCLSPSLLRTLTRSGPTPETVAAESHGISHEQHDLLTSLNTACTAVFVLEAALKIYALSFAEYIREAWNVFDFSVAGISVVAEVGPGPPSEEHAHAPSCARAPSHGRGAWACARGRWSRPSPPS